jgi:8-oxo-dGTP pyrophosphatase MutT (NUDIX family)
VVDRPDPTVLLTQRTKDLTSHAGQVAFPGGKIDADDADAVAAAYREANEEVALEPGEARLLGYLPNYFTGTNYLITPVVARVRPSGPFRPNPGEVDDVFEVPLGLLMHAASYRTLRIKRKGVEHTSWQIDYEGHLIWGITANLTRHFYERALAGERA